MSSLALIDELTTLYSRTTAGKWSWEDGPPTLYTGRDAKHHGYNLLGRLDPSNTADMDFIVAIHNAFPVIVRVLCAQHILLTTRDTAENHEEFLSAYAKYRDAMVSAEAASLREKSEPKPI